MTQTKPAPSGYRILIVDDEKPVLDLMADILGAQGWSVDPIASPQIALQKAKRNKYDALVLDVYMPELPGMLFHAKLRMIDKELAGRTVFVSGHFSRQELKRDLERNAVLLSKPFMPDELVEAVRQMLPDTPRAPGAR